MAPLVDQFVDRTTKILLIFDPTGGRSLFHEKDKGEVLPVTLSLDRLAEYARFLEWAKRCDIDVYPIVTKVDLIDLHEFQKKTIPELRVFLISFYFLSLNWSFYKNKKKCPR